MNIFSFKIQSLVHKMNIAIIIFFAQFLLIIGENESPNEITDNYIPIIHLLDGQTFKNKTSQKILICSYDSNFSNNITVEQKNFLCLIKGISSSDIDLYVINNNTYGYTYKCNITNPHIEDNLKEVNIIPYYKGKLKFVITRLISNNLFFFLLRNK